MISFKRTDSSNNDFQDLVKLLDADLSIRDGEDHSFYSQFNKIDTLRHVMVCYEDRIPIGCGAFKEFDKQTVEIKRMYVSPSHRGQGIGLLILQQLENWASELNYSHGVLETGKKQPEAIRLYQKAGYIITENYGQYTGIVNSVCMKKNISYISTPGASTS